MPPGALLHSLAEHREPILGCLDAVRPRRVVEIGSETGAMTDLLHDWAIRNDAVLVSVEPDPTPAVRRAAQESDHLELVVGASPWALEGIQRIEGATVAVIDGDHNHWTVSRELEWLAASGDEWLAVLHDVGWPCARRDQYYAPERLPRDAVHPHAYDKGVVPGDPGLVDGGLRGEGAFAYAAHEGGERNGVLTAVEDFRAARGGLAYHHIPGVFGVGVLSSGAAAWAAGVASALAPYDGNPLIERLEANRLELYLRLLPAPATVTAEQDAFRRAIAEREERLEALSAEHVRLRLELAELGERTL